MTEGWTTRPGTENPPVTAGLSPLVLFHKWHRYDVDEETHARSFETSSSRVPFLDDVAAAVRSAAGSRYTRWFEHYRSALVALGVEELRAPTVWRLVAGMGTNPALETGLHLHPLYGVPYLPGSTVKGLAHAVAEGELLHEEAAERPTVAALLADGDELAALLAGAERVHRLFGSLTLVPGPARTGDDGEQLPPPPTPRSLLQALVHDESFADLPESVRARARGLLLHTGGRLRFYDAMPLPGQGDLVEPDILNPHYPDYYRDEEKTVPPSDDQNPVPVYLLAVRPGVEFVFAFRLEPLQGDAENTGVEPGDARQVREWLTKGLTEQGVGAKTAAGYGYFESPEESGRERAGNHQSPAPRTAPGGRATWRQATLLWKKNESVLVASCEGDKARARGREILATLTPAELKKLTERGKILTRDVEVERRPDGGFEIIRI